MKKNILIRCDAGHKSGLGHLIRCKAIAEILKSEYDYKIKYCMIREKGNIKDLIKDQIYFKNSSKKYHSEKDWIIDLITNNSIDLIIFDIRTNLSYKDILEIKKHNVIIASIDDSSERRLVSNLVFYPPVPQLKTLNWNGFKGEKYIGWDWVPIGLEFSKNNKSPTRKDSFNILKILISMGGSDPLGLTIIALKSLNKIKSNIIVTIIVGNSFNKFEELKKEVNSSNKRVKIIINPKNIAIIMSKHDFAICSFGMMAYELASQSIKSCYLCITEDHAISASALEKSGFGISLGNIKNLSKVSITSSIYQLVQEEIKNLDISNKKFNILSNKIDGLGSLRIANIIYNSLNQ